MTRPRLEPGHPGVWASGLANGGSLDNAQPGLDFFKKLNDAGNFVPVIAKTATDRPGRDPDPIALDLQRPRRQATRSPAIRRSRSSSRRAGRFGGIYVQAISAFAPHPNAAKLWMEFLYCDEGQNIWLKGYCNPIRYDAMVAAGTVDGGPAGQAARHHGRRLADLDQINAGHRH